MKTNRTGVPSPTGLVPCRAVSGQSRPQAPGPLWASRERPPPRPPSARCAPVSGRLRRRGRFSRTAAGLSPFSLGRRAAGSGQRAAGGGQRRQIHPRSPLLPPRRLPWPPRRGASQSPSARCPCLVPPLKSSSLPSVYPSQGESHTQTGPAPRNKRRNPAGARGELCCPSSCVRQKAFELKELTTGCHTNNTSVVSWVGQVPPPLRRPPRPLRPTSLADRAPSPSAPLPFIIVRKYPSSLAPTLAGTISWR